MPGFTFVILLIAFWDLFWRGKALWRAAQKSQLYWFIALLLVNSMGILPIIYLVFFSKSKKK